MFKLVCLLLTLSFSLNGRSQNEEGTNDTINTVSIRVNLKTRTPAQTSFQSADREKKKISQKKHLGHTKVQTTPSRQADTPAHSNSNDTSKFHLIARYLDTSISIREKNESGALSFNSIKLSKDTFILLSLLLITTGTIIIVFFRSGLPLIIAILLLVAGYYTLIYSLLFMN